MTDPAESESPSGHDGRDPLAVVLALDQVQDRLHSYVRRRISDVHDAEAVYWETFEAFSAYVDARPCPPADFCRLLFGIASKKVADYWRAERRRRHSILVEPSDAHLLAQKWSSPYETVEQRVDLVRAVAEAPLDDRMRRALVLVAVDQLSQDEAAAVMGIHRSKIRRLLAKAGEVIRSHGRLDEYAGADGAERTRRESPGVQP
ncbi:RNA polymerase sigma factor [Amycolatopsis sp. AA4]|uniref:RNA polymerase sigma factor n=1 Tax=Actinomycetes TaxID=1760 RepID=UPI0001B55000|nr:MULTISPECIES: RNA polymerase sigma factor [Actinomycetes]ATY11103.1 RNA polymerase sigma factor [Amycolatopsis sp. AA4]